MTDEQIIDTLRCCQDSLCMACPNKNCTDDIFQLALDLINRQKAEINNLKAELSAMRSMVNSSKMYIEKKEAEIKSLKKKNAILIRNADTAFQDGLNENRDLFKKEVEPEIRAEAIKEFAERLKEIIYTHGNIVDVDGVVLLTRIDNSIDNLVKEMTEGNNDRQS